MYEISSDEWLELKTRVSQSYKEADTVLTEIPDGILLLSDEGRILVCNSQAKEILNIPQNLTIINEPFTSLFPDSFFGFSVEEALQALSAPRTIRITLTQNNQDRDIEIFVKRNSSNGYLFILMRDRSDYRQMENAIEKYRNIAELGKMTATLAHEIRNPLSGIIGFASLLKSELQSTRHRRMLSSLIEGAQSLNTLVSSMLEYTKIRPLKLQTVDIQDFFSSLIPLLSISFPMCHFERKTTQPILRAIDTDRMNSAVWNLVKNAAEATEEPISLTLHPSGNISVSNPGSIAPHVMEKLFSPFFTTKPQGNGLGLAEAQKIMKLHGGDIHVCNENACVTFTLQIPHPLANS